MNTNTEAELRKSFRETLIQFQNSNEDEYLFPSNLTKIERRIIHEIADEILLIHYSKSVEGSKRSRQISIRRLPPLLQTGKYIDGTWQIYDASKENEDIQCETLTILSFNVLSDLLFAYLSTDENIRIKRRDEIFLFLKNQNADIITLQEVIPEFHRHLLAQPWY